MRPYEYLVTTVRKNPEELIKTIDIRHGKTSAYEPEGWEDLKTELGEARL